MADQLKNGQFEFTARLDAVKKIDTANGIKYIHKFLIPAPDQYSTPTQLYVGSPRQIGDVTSDQTVKVSIYGWSRKSNGNSYQNHALEEVI